MCLIRRCLWTLPKLTCSLFFVGVNKYCESVIGFGPLFRSSLASAEAPGFGSPLADGCANATAKSNKKEKKSLRKKNIFIISLTKLL
jgi:hypothetical protein